MLKFTSKEEYFKWAEERRRTRVKARKRAKALAKGGRLVTYGRTTGRMAETNISLVFWNQLHLIGSTMSNRKEFAEVMRLIFQGRLQPVIDSVFPFERTAEAYTRLAKGEQFGKIVLAP